MNVEHVKVPPIKIQGIKTKLVPFIAENIEWDDSKGIWYEPFMGSGVVGFNLAPKLAIFSDINPHIIGFYNDVKNHVITPEIVREYLEVEGAKLAETPADKSSYYYEVRNRFNENANSLDFLFLQRSNFNGMIRFSKNGYNVPFGRKPERFRPALITKIVNQVKWISDLIDTHDWTFEVNTWQDALQNVTTDDFVYMDPPYIGRNAEYFTPWVEEDANALADYFNSRKDIHFGLSMWAKNDYRENDHLSRWRGSVVTNEHFYFLGGKETNRNPVIEALVIG